MPSPASGLTIRVTAGFGRVAGEPLGVALDRVVGIVQPVGPHLGVDVDERVPDGFDVAEMTEFDARGSHEASDQAAAISGRAFSLSRNSFTAVSFEKAVSFPLKVLSRSTARWEETFRSRRSTP